jgi:hypothetical protein
MQINTNHGRVITVGDGIATIVGLPGAMLGELVFFPKSSLKGLILNLLENITNIVILRNGGFTKLNHKGRRFNIYALTPVIAESQTTTTQSPQVNSGLTLVAVGGLLTVVVGIVV